MKAEAKKSEAEKATAAAKSKEEAKSDLSKMTME